jgi:excisionase family DNA binding protein
MTTDALNQFHEEISTVAAAEKYKLTPSYIARLARRQTIRARKFGRDWIIDEQALKEYLAQPRKPGPRPNTMKKQEKSGSVSPLISPQ